MSGVGRDDNLNTYLAIALIAGIVAILAVSFYYEIQVTKSNPGGKVVVPVVTVTATKVVVVTVGPSTTCSTNQTTSTNSSSPC